MAYDISEALKKRKITQTQAAESLGISKPYMSQICSGARTPSVSTLKRLADFLEISPDDLLGTGSSIDQFHPVDARPIELSVRQIAYLCDRNQKVSDFSGFIAQRPIPGFMIDRDDIVVVDHSAKLVEGGLAGVMSTNGLHLGRFVEEMLMSSSFERIGAKISEMRRVTAILRSV